MNQNQEHEKLSVTILDLKVAIAAGICLIVAIIFRRVGIMFHYQGTDLEIIQRMTACIGCFLCVQDSFKPSFRQGINRTIITAIGGGVGIVIILINDAVSYDWLFVIMMILGIIATLFLCKAARVPYISARIGCVTLVLVACTLNSTARIWYAVFRLLSTVFAVIVVMLVAWIFDIIIKNTKQKKNTEQNAMQKAV